MFTDDGSGLPNGESAGAKRQSAFVVWTVCVVAIAICLGVVAVVATGSVSNSGGKPASASERCDVVWCLTRADGQLITDDQFARYLPINDVLVKSWTVPPTGLSTTLGASSAYGERDLYIVCGGGGQIKVTVHGDSGDATATFTCNEHMASIGADFDMKVGEELPPAHVAAVPAGNVVNPQMFVCAMIPRVANAGD